MEWKDKNLDSSNTFNDIFASYPDYDKLKEVMLAIQLHIKY